LKSLSGVVYLENSIHAQLDSAVKSQITNGCATAIKYVPSIVGASLALRETTACLIVADVIKSASSISALAQPQTIISFVQEITSVCTTWSIILAMLAQTSLEASDKIAVGAALINLSDTVT